MKGTNKVKRFLALLLVSTMLISNNAVIYAANVVDSATTTEMSEASADVQESVDETEASVGTQEAEVSVGYIFESPTEEGKDVFIQLGTSEDVFSEIVITIERNGETQEYNADAVIENVAAFHLETDDKLISISGKVNDTAFQSDLSVLDESQGEEIVIDEIEAVSEESGELTEEDIENIEIESYIVDNTEEDENAIGDAMVETNPISTFSLSRSRIKSEYVVVIDPGHSIQSAGTQRTWDGVTYYEHVLVMKIARYLVAELEQYSGVTVYLTRDENSHRSLEDRVKYAASVNADMLVSIHLNATGETVTTASGVTAMVAKVGTYNTENAQEGQAIARSILDELVALGFKDRGFTIRMSENGTTYADGSLADYYQIIKCGQEYNVPSMIIEHGFLNNESDFRKYLSTEAGLKSLGVADATGIAKYLGLTKATENVLSGWQTINGKTYYYENGKPVTGTPIIDGNKYWFDPDGVQRTGWLYLLNWKMYFDPETGIAKTGFAEIEGKTYLFNSSGVMQNYAGTPIIDGKKYWFSLDNASLKTGWLYLGNWKMYFDPVTYAAKTGIAEINGKHYLFNEDGVMQNYAGTPVINGKKYWFSLDDASLKTGWLVLGNWVMYFDPKTYEAVTGWVTIDGRKYYFDQNGVAKQGFIVYEGNQYYVYSNGTYAKGIVTIDGDKYAFGDDGKQLYGWYVTGNWKYYFDASNNGAAVTTYIKIDGVTYYFNSDGTLSSTSNNYYLSLKDPANGKTYTLESQFATDPEVDDKTLLTALTYTESGNQDLECQVATALVIMNRVASKSYPDTLRYVVYQKSQFTVARTGALKKILVAYQNNDQTQLKWLAKTEQAVDIAIEIMADYIYEGKDRTIDGVTLPNGKTDFDYLGFMTPAAFESCNLDPVKTEAIQIDDVMFFTKWITKS